MPFTPLHMGPGLLIKAALQGSFSLMLFGWAQILMDLQPLFVMWSGAGRLHGFSHTYFGATLLGLAAALTAKNLAELGLRILRIQQHQQPIRIQWPVAFASAFIGAYSHVALDAVMHNDMTPYFPFTETNGLWGVITIERLHQICIYSGLVGGVLYYVTVHRLATRRRGETRS